MNTPFFQVSTLEFGQGVDAPVQEPFYSAQKWALGPVCARFLLVLRKSTSLNALRLKMASDRAKWRVLKVNATPFFATTWALVLVAQV